jgi:hypothetical protein
VSPKHPPGPPMDLANMRRQGVHHLVAYCLNDSCRHQALNLEPLVVAEIKVGLGAVRSRTLRRFCLLAGQDIQSGRRRVSVQRFQRRPSRIAIAPVQIT